MSVFEKYNITYSQNENNYFVINNKLLVKTNGQTFNGKLQIKPENVIILNEEMPYKRFMFMITKITKDKCLKRSYDRYFAKFVNGSLELYGSCLTINDFELQPELFKHIENKSKEYYYDLLTDVQRNVILECINGLCKLEIPLTIKDIPETGVIGGYLDSLGKGFLMMVIDELGLDENYPLNNEEDTPVIQLLVKNFKELSKYLQ